MRSEALVLDVTVPIPDVVLVASFVNYTTCIIIIFLVNLHS